MKIRCNFYIFHINIENYGSGEEKRAGGTSCDFSAGPLVEVICREKFINREWHCASWL